MNKYYSIITRIYNIQKYTLNSNIKVTFNPVIFIMGYFKTKSISEFSKLVFIFNLKNKISMDKDGY